MLIMNFTMAAEILINSVSQVRGLFVSYNEDFIEVWYKALIIRVIRRAAALFRYEMSIN